jgi:dienelactone hydrolase
VLVIISPLVRLRGILVSLLAWPILTSCHSTSVVRADEIARTAGFDSTILRGAGFAHQAYYTIVPGTHTLFVFLEGDGSPWTNYGTRESLDPTPRVPLALQLAARTQASVLYLGRPCYYGARGDRECSADLWTSKRYSAVVVNSMAVALNDFLATHHFGEVTLIGYSGGGTLAVLMAPRVAEVRVVVTVAANLDIAAWTSFHGYLPLEGSLNPVVEPPLSARLREWHLVGERDRNVPAKLNSRYWERVSQDRLWLYPRMDHACCWVEEWPEIFARLLDASALRLQ